MATTRGTRSKDTKVEKVVDQTPDEAEEAAAIAAEDTVDQDQTAGEALLANAIAEQETVEAVPVAEDDVIEVAQADDGQFRIKVIKTGLMVSGRVLKEGTTVVVTEELANQSEEDQKKFYGSVYFEKI